MKPAGKIIEGKIIKARDKSVRDHVTLAKLVNGQIVVENQTCGILFSFPSAVWPVNSYHQRAWVERLTPWWDLEQTPSWSPTSERLRESCVKAINSLLVPLPVKPETANGRTAFAAAQLSTMILPSMILLQ